MRIILACTGVASDSMALVDVDRLQELSAFNWFASARRGPVRYIKCKPVYLWHEVAGCRALPRGHSHDCRRAMLIPATFRQVCQRRRKRSDFCNSIYKGVSRYRNRWGARINMRHIGYFDSEIDAGRAYDRAAREIFGAFARPNFPD